LVPVLENHPITILYILDIVFWFSSKSTNNGTKKTQKMFYDCEASESG
jgi:hypothetical protein